MYLHGWQHQTRCALTLNAQIRRHCMTVVTLKFARPSELQRHT